MISKTKTVTKRKKCNKVFEVMNFRGIYFLVHERVQFSFPNFENFMKTFEKMCKEYFEKCLIESTR